MTINRVFVIDWRVTNFFTGLGAQCLNFGACRLGVVFLFCLFMLVIYQIEWLMKWIRRAARLDFFQLQGAAVESHSGRTHTHKMMCALFMFTVINFFPGCPVCDSSSSSRSSLFYWELVSFSVVVIYNPRKSGQAALLPVADDTTRGDAALEQPGERARSPPHPPRSLSRARFDGWLRLSARRHHPSVRRRRRRPAGHVLANGIPCGRRRAMHGRTFCFNIGSSFAILCLPPHSRVRRR